MRGLLGFSLLTFCLLVNARGEMSSVFNQNYSCIHSYAFRCNVFFLLKASIDLSVIMVLQPSFIEEHKLTRVVL